MQTNKNQKKENSKQKKITKINTKNPEKNRKIKIILKIKKIATEVGLEPTTFRLEVCCATIAPPGQLQYIQKACLF